MHKLPFLLTLACGLSFTLAQDATPPTPSDEPVQVAKAIPVTAPVAEPARAATASALPETPAAAEDDSPVPLPSAGHYARLWTDSLFTTRALPMPESPTGPAFTDNLSLSGTFEDHGKLTAILIDKTTSNVLQAYIGEDNEQGFRISKIVPGATPDLIRIQLQKGNLSGWVSFSEATTAEAAGAPMGAPAVQGKIPSAIPTRTSAVPMVPQALPYTPPPAAAVVPAPESLPTPAAMPSLRGGMPGAAPAFPNDPPLPPP